MYRIIKEKGNNSNVALVNTETKANLVIGKLSMTMLEILADEGHKVEDGTLRLTDAWDFEITDAGAREISKQAMKMSKPIRAKQSKSESEQPKDLFQKPNKDIDAMDVLLGLASYN